MVQLSPDPHANVHVYILPSLRYGRLKIFPNGHRYKSYVNSHTNAAIFACDVRSTVFLKSVHVRIFEFSAPT